jgi:hypothetical protein
MSEDRTKADKAWEARQEAARYRIFNAATNAAEATDEADDENYFAVLDQAGHLHCWHGCIAVAKNLKRILAQDAC